MAANPRIETPHFRQESTSEPEAVLSAPERHETGPSEASITASDSVPAAASPEGPESRHEAISRAAYYLSEARGFEPGHELDDWLAAEQQTHSH